MKRKQNRQARTVSLEPNYDALYKRFASVIDGEAADLVACISDDKSTLEAVQSWLAPLAIAFQSARTTAQIVTLRDHVSDVLAKVAKARDAAPAQYKLDDSTFEHLTAWCERESRDADEALELRGKMIDYVQSLPVEDAEYSVSHGWPHVRNLAEA
jgi:hypothetical protein